MPAPKPPKTKEWAVVDTATTGSPVVEPDSSFKTNGVQPGAKLFAQFLNWAWDIDTNWQAYLRDFEAIAHTWTAPQIFNLGTIVGNLLLSTGALANQARILANTFVGTADASAKTLVFSGQIGTKFARIYLDRGLNLEITVNAVWDNTLGTPAWTKDVNSDPAQLFRVGATSVVAAAKASAENTAWSNALGVSTGWTNETALLDGFASSVFAWGASWGGAMLGTAANAALARFAAARAANATSVRTLVFELLDPTGSGFSVRVYRSNFDTEGWEIAFNCHWDKSGANQWVLDSTGEATMLAFGRRKMSAFRKSSDSAGVLFTDDATGWDLGFPGYQLYWGNDYDKNTILPNTMTHQNMAKAVALLHFDGTGANPTFSPAVGFNALGAVFTGALTGDKLRLTFAKPWAVSAGFICRPQVGSYTQAVRLGGSTAATSLPQALITLKDTTKIEFQLVDGNQTLWLNSGTGAQNFIGDIEVIAFGAQ